MIKAFLFDMDGVLVDTETTYFQAAGELLKQYGKELKLEEVEHLSGSTTEDFWWEAKQIYQIDDQPINKLKDECSRIYHELIKHIQPLPGVVPFLKQAKGKLKMAIVTNAGERSKKVIMSSAKIEQYFDRVFTKQDYPEPKPSPKAYLFAAEQLEVSPKECVVFEDSLRGASAAKKAGMYTVVMPKGVTAHQDLSFADKIVKSFDELNIDELMQL